MQGTRWPVVDSDMELGMLIFAPKSWLKNGPGFVKFVLRWNGAKIDGLVGRWVDRLVGRQVDR